MKIRLGIVDDNQNYIRRLIDYFTSRYADTIEVFAFSDATRLKNHTMSKKLDVVIADEELLPETFELPKSTMLAYFSDSLEVKSIRGIKAICKYQRAEQLYREILNLYAELDRQASYRMSANGCPLFLFMGVSGGSGTTTVSAACALSMTYAGKKVLYLNLEENGVISHIFQGSGQMSLSDVLYAVKTNHSNLALKLESMVQRDKSGVYFYEPFRITLDASEMNADNLSTILSVLTKYRAYDAIVVDSDASISPKRQELLKVASSVFLVSNGTEVANSKLTRLLREISILDENDESSRIMNRIKVIYNRMSRLCEQANTGYQENVFATIGAYESLSSMAIVESIAKQGFFEQVLRG